MFTGIIEEVGVISRIKKAANSAVLTISARKILSDINIGDSISVNGICLTVVSFTDLDFSADVMHETLARSSLGNLAIGTKVNIERAMAANGRYGGHFVTGHIDGTGTITSIKKDDNAIWYDIKTSEVILRLIVEKGSIAIDGISLTVAKVSKDHFSVSVIPHTLENTTFVFKQIGDSVNLENDCIGKYIEKLLGNTNQTNTISRELLMKAGF